MPMPLLSGNSKSRSKAYPFFYKTLDLKLYFNVIFEIAGCKAVRRYSGEPK
jgi:hypothetical protein|tara:strand:+ start:308 stop:460 length:153 start_codon:yes stop_codon:yes gene_type:complete